jgi:hypothetical protein
VIKKGLERGILNSRALARFIQEVDGVNASTDAILGFIRRYPIIAKQTLPRRLAFTGSDITMRTKIGDLALEKRPGTMKKISDFASRIKGPKREHLRILTGLQHIRIIADQKELSQFRKEFSNKDVIRYSENLAEISLFLPPEAENEPGIYAKITSELALNDISLVGVWCCAPEAILVVEEEDGPKALEALKRMASEA